MTTLVIGPEQERQAAELVRFAQANPLSREYLLRMSAGFNPSDPRTRNPAGAAIAPHYTIDLPIGLRVTYTEEEQPVGRCRHLSASVASKGAAPAPVIVDELLALFGFSARVSDQPMIWAERYSSERIAINVLERVDGQPLGSEPAAGMTRQ